MQKRWLYLGGAIVIVVAIGGIVAFSYLQSLLAPVPLTISYATTQTQMPDGAACAGGSEEAGGVAKEILNLETDYIYVAGGANAMPDDVWADYSFRLPIFKNSTRNLMFQGSCFFRSPDVAADCAGEACFSIDELLGYSWLNLTQVVGQECFPSADGCSGDQVAAGYVSINTIAKCHRLVYEGPTVYILADGTGNKFIMHATATGTPDLTGPTLPAGWTLSERTISEPLVLLPFGGGDNCYYNVVRDNLVQSYHQFAYASERYPANSAG